MRAFEKVRVLDVVLTVALVGLASFLMVVNIEATPADRIRVESHSWGMLPGFVVAFVPVLWWRRNLFAGLAISGAAMALHDLLFGTVVRCGAGLPLSFVLAFLVALRYDRRRALVGLGLVVGLAALVVVRDSQTGLVFLP